MPGPFVRSCLEPGCPELVYQGRCAEHTKDVDKRYVRRGANIYGTKRWRTRRRWFLTDYPWCSVMDCTLMATDVDHILPVGTPGVDPWDESNWQSLCHKHHSAKTIREVFHRG
jgi:5-methylcytosine-specific restriction protein A